MEKAQTLKQKQPPKKQEQEPQEDSMKRETISDEDTSDEQMSSEVQEKQEKFVIQDKSTPLWRTNAFLRCLKMLNHG